MNTPGLKGGPPLLQPSLAGCPRRPVRGPHHGLAEVMGGVRLALPTGCRAKASFGRRQPMAPGGGGGGRFGSVEEADPPAPPPGEGRPTTR